MSKSWDEVVALKDNSNNDNATTRDRYRYTSGTSPGLPSQEQVFRHEMDSQSSGGRAEKSYGSADSQDESLPPDFLEGLFPTQALRDEYVERAQQGWDRAWVPPSSNGDAENGGDEDSESGGRIDKAAWAAMEKSLSELEYGARVLSTQRANRHRRDSV